MKDERLVAACNDVVQPMEPRGAKRDRGATEEEYVGSIDELEDRVAYVEEAAPMIEATLAGASRRLLSEYEAGAVSAAAIAELEQALQDLRGFEDALEVTLG